MIERPSTIPEHEWAVGLWMNRTMIGARRMIHSATSIAMALGSMKPADVARIEIAAGENPEKANLRAAEAAMAALDKPFGKAVPA